MVVDRKRQEAIAADVLENLDSEIDPAMKIGTLKVAQRQLIEIARALIDQAKVVAFDEPTSSLTPHEFERLAELVMDLSSRGVSIIYVSHRMDEIFRLCGRVTILRDGEFVDDLEIARSNKNEIVTKMVGRKLMSSQQISHATEKVALRVENLSRPPAVRGANFSVHCGEVLGIAGLVGAGRSELVRLIAGADKPTSGTVEVFGKKIPTNNVGAAIRAGMGLLPEERRRDGIVPIRPVDSNMALPHFGYYTYAGVVSRRKLNTEATRIMKQMDLRPLDVSRPIVAFSGGNQQKAIIGRWLAAGADILLFDEPTRGIDVNAKSEIYALIERLASEGKAIIVVSSELPELIRLADRVLVMREGSISADLPKTQLDEKTVMEFAVLGGNRQDQPKGQMF